MYNMPVKPYKCIFCFITSDILLDTAGAGGDKKEPEPASAALPYGTNRAEKHLGWHICCGGL